MVISRVNWIATTLIRVLITPLSRVPMNLQVNEGGGDREMRRGCSGPQAKSVRFRASELPKSTGLRLQRHHG